MSAYLVDFNSKTCCNNDGLGGSKQSLPKFVAGKIQNTLQESFRFFGDQ